VDGLKGFPEAIEAADPQTQVQICIVHLVRHSLNFASWKQRKEMTDDLKERLYRALTVEQAKTNLEAIGEKWNATHPKVS
jgi:putative transposase